MRMAVFLEIYVAILSALKAFRRFLGGVVEFSFSKVVPCWLGFCEILQKRLYLEHLYQLLL